jgi:uncharacterized protein with GYD domain
VELNFHQQIEKEAQMGIYITQGNYTGSAMKGMVNNPEDRERVVAGLMESVGAKLLQYYVTTGEYDFLVVTESNSLQDIVAGLMVAGASGGVTNMKTVQALTTQEAKVAMERANLASSGFVAAGGTS